MKRDLSWPFNALWGADRSKATIFTIFIQGDKMTAPFDFYKSSLELWTKAAQEFQSNYQKLLEQAAQTANEDLAQTNAELQQLVQEHNWLALASLPQQAAWRAYVRQVSAWQAAVQNLAEQQPDLGSGIQKSLAGWQSDSAKAVVAAFGEWNNPAAVQKYWQSFFPQGAQDKPAGGDQS